MATSTKIGLTDLLRREINPDVSLDELVRANRLLLGEIRSRQNRENRKALADFRQNDKVQLKQEHDSAKLPGGTVGIVKKLGFKNITVDFGVYKVYRVPAGWLEAAPENASFVPRHDTLTPPRRRASRPAYEETPPEMA